MKVVRSIALETGILDPKWADDIGLTEVSGNGARWWKSLSMGAKLRMSMGMAWESWYLQNMSDLLPSVLPHPHEMCLNGIYMTHDGESLDTIWTPQGPRLEQAIHEVKLTYKSTNTVGELGDKLRSGVSKNWMVETQTKSYCKGLDCLVGYVHMLFVNGDYSHPYEPVLKVWKLTFERAERDESWDRILGHLHEARTHTMEE